MVTATPVTKVPNISEFVELSIVPTELSALLTTASGDMDTTSLLVVAGFVPRPTMLNESPDDSGVAT